MSRVSHIVLLIAALAAVPGFACRSSNGQGAGDAKRGDAKPDDRPEWVRPQKLKGVVLRDRDEFEFRQYWLATRIPPSEFGTFPPSKQLVIMMDGEIERTVQSFEDLGPWIDVDRSDSVVSAARLLTDERTHDCGVREWYGWEILASGKLAGFDAAIDPDVFATLKWSPLEARPTNQGWTIKRFVVVREWESPAERIVAVEEEITTLGTYRRASETTVWKGKLKNVIWPVKM